MHFTIDGFNPSVYRGTSEHLKGKTSKFQNLDPLKLKENNETNFLANIFGIASKLLNLHRTLTKAGFDIIEHLGHASGTGSSSFIGEFRQEFPHDKQKYLGAQRTLYERLSILPCDSRLVLL